MKRACRTRVIEVTVNSSESLKRKTEKLPDIIPATTAPLLTSHSVMITEALWRELLLGIHPYNTVGVPHGARTQPWLYSRTLMKSSSRGSKRCMRASGTPHCSSRRQSRTHFCRSTLTPTSCRWRCRPWVMAMPTAGANSRRHCFPVLRIGLHYYKLNIDDIRSYKFHGHETSAYSS